MTDEGNFPLFTRSRSEDPETSKQAAAQVKPRFNEIQQQVIAMLERNPSGLTDLELAEKLGDTKRSTFRTRRAELTEMGMVVWTGRHREQDGSKRRVWALKKFNAGVPVEKATKPAPAPSQVPQTFDLISHLCRQIAFSRVTFGPDPRQGGVCDHVRKELREIEKLAPDERQKRLKEWIDVIILGFDGAWRSQIGSVVMLSDEDIAWLIVSAIVEKQSKNERRDWPDWRTMSPDEAIEHTRGIED